MHQPLHNWFKSSYGTVILSSTHMYLRTCCIPNIYPPYLRRTPTIDSRRRRNACSSPRSRMVESISLQMCSCPRCPRVEMYVSLVHQVTRILRVILSHRGLDHRLCTRASCLIPTLLAATMVECLIRHTLPCARALFPVDNPRLLLFRPLHQPPNPNPNTTDTLLQLLLPYLPRSTSTPRLLLQTWRLHSLV
jgi:hypothetical protein